MTLLRNIGEIPRITGGVVSIGNFDGVHRGHQAMAAVLVERARAVNGPAVMLTFDPHPMQFLRPDRVPPYLTTLEQRAELLSQLGVDAVVAYPTTPALLQRTADEFFRDVVCTQFAARGLVEGPNFAFGRDRGGNITVLRQLCDAQGLTLDIIPPVMVDGQLVSSSVIRSLLLRSDVSGAAQLLGRPYGIEGTVVTGAQRGRTIGFPTANLASPAMLVPAHGVYAGVASVLGERFAAAIHIGPNPTFGEAQAKVEIHLLDFAGDIYGQPLDVEFLAHLRHVRKFNGKDELIAQLQADIAATRQAWRAVGSSSK